MSPMKEEAMLSRPSREVKQSVVKKCFAGMANLVSWDLHRVLLVVPSIIFHLTVLFARAAASAPDPRRAHSRVVAF